MMKKIQMQRKNTWEKILFFYRFYILQNCLSKYLPFLQSHFKHLKFFIWKCPLRMQVLWVKAAPLRTRNKSSSRQTSTLVYYQSLEIPFNNILLFVRFWELNNLSLSKKNTQGDPLTPSSRLNRINNLSPRHSLKCLKQ